MWAEGTLDKLLEVKCREHAQTTFEEGVLS